MPSLYKLKVVLDERIENADNSKYFFSLFKESIDKEIKIWEIVGPYDNELKFYTIVPIIKNLESIVSKEVHFKFWEINSKDIEIIFSSFSKLDVVDLSMNIIDFINDEFEIDVFADFNVKFIHFNKWAGFELTQFTKLFSKFWPFISHWIKGIEVTDTGIDAKEAERVLNNLGYKAQVEDDSPYEP